MKYFGMTTLVLAFILGAGASATKARSALEGHPHGRKLLCAGEICDAVRTVHGDTPPAAPVVVSKPAVATSSGATVSSSNSAGSTGKDKDVVISADKNHNGNVNCPGGNESQCRAAGSNTGKNYNNGANGAAGNNGNGGYDVVNKNDCNPSTHYACCLYKGKYNTDEYCKGSAECCSKH